MRDRCRTGRRTVDGIRPVARVSGRSGAGQRLKPLPSSAFVATVPSVPWPKLNEPLATRPVAVAVAGNTHREPSSAFSPGAPTASSVRPSPLRSRRAAEAVVLLHGADDVRRALVEAVTAQARGSGSGAGEDDEAARRGDRALVLTGDAHRDLAVAVAVGVPDGHGRAEVVAVLGGSGDAGRVLVEDDGLGALRAARAARYVGEHAALGERQVQVAVVPVDGAPDGEVGVPVVVHVADGDVLAALQVVAVFPLDGGEVRAESGRAAETDHDAPGVVLVAVVGDDGEIVAAVAVQVARGHVEVPPVVGVRDLGGRRRDAVAGEGAAERVQGHVPGADDVRGAVAVEVADGQPPAQAVVLLAGQQGRPAGQAARPAPQDGHATARALGRSDLLALRTDDQVRVTVLVEIGGGDRAAEGVTGLRGAGDSRRGLGEHPLGGVLDSVAGAVGHADVSGALEPLDGRTGRGERQVGIAVAVEVGAGAVGVGGRRGQGGGGGQGDDCGGQGDGQDDTGTECSGCHGDSFCWDVRRDGAAGRPESAVPVAPRRARLRRKWVGSSGHSHPYRQACRAKGCARYGSSPLRFPRCAGGAPVIRRWITDEIRGTVR